MARFFDADGNTLCSHTKKCVNAVAASKGEKIVWDIDNNHPETHLIWVDGDHANNQVQDGARTSSRRLV